MKYLATFLLVLATMNLEAGDGTVRPALNFEKIFGGTGSDSGTAVAVDAAGNVYITGTTTSLDFPVKNGFQPSIGGAPLRASADSGRSWTSSAIASPVLTVAASTNPNGVFFAGTLKGVYKSFDAGKTWIFLSSATQFQVNAIVVDASDPSVVYSASYDGVLKSQDAGLTWRGSFPRPRNDDDVYMLVSPPARPGTLFAGIAGGGIESAPNLYRSTDAGATWSVLPNSPINTFALTTDPSSPDVLYAGVPFGTGLGIYKTSDGGDTWTKLAALQLAFDTLAVAASPTAVYAATDKGVMRSRDGGTTWTATSITASADTVAVDPTNPHVVYVNAGGIYVSTDDGDTWSSVLPIRQYVQTISIVPAPPTIIPGRTSIVFVGATPGQNAFVSKWSADGTQMLYSTYLGGSYADFPTALAVDDQGNTYITGYTFSTDFPVTPSSLQSKNAGPYNAFFAKISPDGGTLAYSTYLGGSTGDAANAIAVDNEGNAYLTGYAGSVDFPVTMAAAQSTLRQNCSTAPPAGSKTRARLGDAFVAKINATAPELGYSTLLGGTCADEGLGIAVDSSGSAYVVGATTSPDFPATKDAFQETYKGAANTGFLAKLNPQGSAITYATFLGGPGSDSAHAVTLDEKGSIYVAGSSMGFDQILFGLQPSVGVPTIGRLGGTDTFPVPGFPIGGFGAAYVLKLDATASSKQYLNYIGGNFGTGDAIAVDPSGRAWVVGATNPFGIGPPLSMPFPTVHPFQAETGQGFVSEVSADGSAILFSSLLDLGRSLALDAAGNAFVTGTTTNSSVLLDRIDGAVPSAVTVEEPQRLVPRLGSMFPWNGLASSEIIVLTGTGLGPDQEVTAQLTQAGSVATSLAGTSVMFDGVPAPLLSVQAERVVCIVPFEIANRQHSTTVMQVWSNGSNWFNGSSSNAILLGATTSAVEVLSVVNQDGTLNSADHPAAPGSVVAVYAAGFGQTVPASVDGQINGTGTLKASPVGVNIANQDAQILYAGPAPGQVAGITQINFQVPQLTPAQYTAYVGWGPLKTYGDYNAVSVYVGK